MEPNIRAGSNRLAPDLSLGLARELSVGHATETFGHGGASATSQKAIVAVPKRATVVPIQNITIAAIKELARTVGRSLTITTAYTTMSYRR